MTPIQAFSRAYETTHPWIKFTLDLEQDVKYRSWLLLGEAQSKSEHIAGAPLEPQIAEELHRVYLTKGIHGTTSIEGNTLSETEVRARIEGSLDLPRSREYQGKEIDNILAICNDLAREIREGRDPGLTVDRIHEFNRRILDGLPLKEDVIPGETRTHSVTVGIGPYRGAPAGDCDYLLNRMVDWLNGIESPADKPELKYPLAVLKSILAHLYIAWIHPFGDGNGRTARMIEFQLMIEAGAPTPAAHLLSNHYNLTRDVYLIELARTSSRPEARFDGFIEYALQGLVDQLREQIGRIRSAQYDVAWQNYVHNQFRDEETVSKRRQKHLVLDMPTNAIPRSKIREVSARVTTEYAGKEAKTVSRDLNALEAKGLIERVGNSYRANRDIIRAFLPLKRAVT
jgi:Fic family protein